MTGMKEQMKRKVFPTVFTLRAAMYHKKIIPDKRSRSLKMENREEAEAEST